MANGSNGIKRFFFDKGFRYRKSRRTVFGIVAVVVAIVALVAVLLMLNPSESHSDEHSHAHISLENANEVVHNGTKKDLSVAHSVIDSLDKTNYFMRCENIFDNLTKSHQVFTHSVSSSKVVDSVYISGSNSTFTKTVEGDKTTYFTDDKSEHAPANEQIDQYVGSFSPDVRLEHYFHNKALSCYEYKNQIYLIGVVDNNEVFIRSKEGGSLLDMAIVKYHNSNYKEKYTFLY